MAETVLVFPLSVSLPSSCRKSQACNESLWKRIWRFLLLVNWGSLVWFLDGSIAKEMQWSWVSQPVSYCKVGSITVNSVWRGRLPAAVRNKAPVDSVRARWRVCACDLITLKISPLLRKSFYIYFTLPHFDSKAETFFCCFFPTRGGAKNHPWYVNSDNDVIFPELTASSSYCFYNQESGSLFFDTKQLNAGCPLRSCPSIHPTLPKTPSR